MPILSAITAAFAKNESSLHDAERAHRNAQQEFQELRGCEGVPSSRLKQARAASERCQLALSRATTARDEARVRHAVATENKSALTAFDKPGAEALDVHSAVLVEMERFAEALRPVLATAHAKGNVAREAYSAIPGNVSALLGLRAPSYQFDALPDNATPAEVLAYAAHILVARDFAASMANMGTIPNTNKFPTRADGYPLGVEYFKDTTDRDRGRWPPYDSQ
jgi:hypothetical protein